MAIQGSLFKGGGSVTQPGSLFWFQNLFLVTVSAVGKTSKQKKQKTKKRRGELGGEILRNSEKISGYIFRNFQKTIKIH